MKVRQKNVITYISEIKCMLIIYNKILSVWVYVYLYIADANFSLYIIAHHKFSQHAVVCNLDLLDNVRSEADLAEGFILLDFCGNWWSYFTWM